MKRFHDIHATVIGSCYFDFTFLHSLNKLWIVFNFKWLQKEIVIFLVVFTKVITFWFITKQASTVNQSCYKIVTFQENDTFYLLTSFAEWYIDNIIFTCNISLTNVHS